MTGKPKLAVWKFASCDGCQLSLLDCEDELLAIAGEVDIAYFLEALERCRRRPYDHLDRRRVGHDAARRREDPARPQRLAGARHDRRQATAGGIQACATSPTSRVHPPRLRLAGTSRRSRPRRRSRARPRRLRAARLPDRQGPVARGDHGVLARPPAWNPLDQRLHGVQAARNGFVVVAHGTPCLGPVTHAGCGALCPAYNRGCYGCFGPKETPNTASLTRRLQLLGLDDRDVERVLPHVQRRRAGVPGRRLDAWLSGGRSRPTTSPASRARAMSGWLRGDTVEHVELRIFEPPRFFEALFGVPRSSNRPTSPPASAASPVGVPTSAVNAIEDLCGVELPGPLQALRRILYCGEWIHRRSTRTCSTHRTSSATTAQSSSRATSRRRSSAVWR